MGAPWVTALIALAGVVGAFLLWLGRLLWHTLQRTIHFLDDYFGQAARDGLTARPGVMARLGTVEGLLDKVLHETTPNGGGNLRDMVARTALDVATIKDEQVRLRAQVELRNPPEGKP